VAGASSFDINVHSNVDQVVAGMRNLSNEVRDKATIRALNNMGAQARTAAARIIREVGYGLKAATVKARLTLIKASAGRLVVTVRAQGRPIPLIEFQARQTSKGVSVKVLNGRRLIAGAFIATMPSGHRGVYVRKAGARSRKVMTKGKAQWHGLPIQELFGPGVPDALANEAVQRALEALVDDKFPQLLRHEVKYLLSR